jgi:hypothetical protein
MSGLLKNVAICKHFFASPYAEIPFGNIMMGSGTKGFTGPYFWCISPAFNWAFRVPGTRLDLYR